jgi:hypothetical protein
MILITGATGTVGSEVVKRLSACGIQVRAVTRDPRKVDANRLPHVQFELRGCRFDEPGVLRRRPGVPVDQLDRALRTPTDRLYAPGTTERRPPHREALTVARRHELAGTVPSLSGSCRSGRPGVSPNVTFLRLNLYMQGLLNFRQSIQEKSAFFAAAGDALLGQ